jgi:hypothetical protein
VRFAFAEIKFECTRASYKELIIAARERNMHNVHAQNNNNAKTAKDNEKQRQLN